jgi:hypothetical protein
MGTIHLDCLIEDASILPLKLGFFYPPRIASCTTGYADILNSDSSKKAGFSHRKTPRFL